MIKSPMYDWILEEGVEKGLEKGREEGVEEGIKKGTLKGAREKALDTARAMLKKGYPLKEIVELTGLSIEEIERLK